MIKQLCDKCGKEVNFFSATLIVTDKRIASKEERIVIDLCKECTEEILSEIEKE